MKNELTRVDEKLEDLGWTWANLARKLNTSDQRVHNWKKRGNIPKSELENISRILGCTVDWIVTGNSGGENASKDDAGNYRLAPGLGLDTTPLGERAAPKFIDIPVFNAELAAGNGTHIDLDQVTEFFPISENRLRDAHVPRNQAAVVKVRGDSMESTLMDGDIVLVDTSIKQPVSGKIFAFAFDEELRVKRFSRKLDGTWRISSDNDDPIYQDEIVSHHNIQQLRMIGQVKTLLERRLG